MSNKESDNSTFFRELEAICSDCAMNLNTAQLEKYGKDITDDKVHAFSYLVKPKNEIEVAHLLKLCNDYDIPVTTRGGGSGLVGGANPIHGGLVLSLEKLDRIVEINSLNKTAIVESGVLTQLFCEAVEREGLYFPVQPGSSSMSFVGGNVATNSGSMSSLKYGTIIDYVLNLEVVLPNGEIIWTGANTSKNATGPNLTKLLVGSEGTLGVITKIVFKLIPKPLKKASLKVQFDTTNLICKAVEEIAASDLRPVEMELVDGKSVELTTAYLAVKSVDTSISKKPHLLISFDGNNEENIDDQLVRTATILEKYSRNEVLVAKSHTEQQRIWNIRMNIGEALKYGGKTYRDLDMAVPVSKLSDYLQFVDDVAQKFKLSIFCFGHAGNGNLHTMMLHTSNSEEQEKAIRAIYTKGIELGGTISGEHGIGSLQKDLMTKQYSDAYLNLLKSIKKAFDPNGILNPGKVYS